VRFLDTMRWTPLVRVAVLAGIGAILSAPAYALSSIQLRQLLVLSDTAVMDGLADSVEWLADNRGVVIGGWEQWPAKPMIAVAPAAGPVVKLERPATPRFALSPTRQEIAYWYTTGGTWAQLAIVPVSGGQPRFVGDPRQVTPAMHLAWPVDNTLCTLTYNARNCLALAIDAQTGVSRPLVEAEGGQWTGLRTSPGSDPIAVWTDRSKTCFRLSVTGRTVELGAEADYDRAKPGGTLFSYFDANAALWVGGRGKQPPTKVTDDAGAACWLPDASALFFARRRALWSVSMADLEQRQVPGSALENAGLEAGAPCGMTCSPDGGAFVYWRQSGVEGQIRRARLGLEEIAVSARFPKGTQAAVGQKMWIATKLYLDKSGAVKEPVWSTVKGEFEVRRVLPSNAETVVEAVSVGAMSGVAVRVAGRAEPEGGAPGLQFTLKPIPDLKAWLHKTTSVGEPLSLNVTRTPLGSPQ